MNSSFNLSTFLFISNKKIIISVYRESNFEKVYEKELLTNNKLNNHIDYKKLDDFLNDNIFRIEKIFDNFVDAFKAQTEKYILNNPLDNSTNLGPVVKLSAANNIRNQVSKALNNGATNIIDGSKFKIDNSENCYVSPSALINVDHSMEFMMDETFGPTVGIKKNKNAIQKLGVR